MADKSKKAPKKAAAKKAPVKKTKSKISPEMAAKFDDAFKRWKNKEQICALAAELGVKRGALRRQLRRRAGGKAEFKALRMMGAGGVRESLGARPKDVNIDKDAKVIAVGGRKDWTSRRVITVTKGGKQVRLDEPLIVHVAGKSGLEYIRAEKNQAADVLCEMGNGLPPARLVVFKQFG